MSSRLRNGVYRHVRRHQGADLGGLWGPVCLSGKSGAGGRVCARAFLGITRKTMSYVKMKVRAHITSLCLFCETPTYTETEDMLWQILVKQFAVSQWLLTSSCWRPGRYTVVNILTFSVSDVESVANAGSHCCYRMWRWHLVINWWQSFLLDANVEADSSLRTDSL